MEKEYETYQNLAKNVENYVNSGGQYVIVQDGALMSVNKSVENIQYVAQIQNIKNDDGGTCPVYDITSQPYYVDVSPELITPMTVDSIQPVTSSAMYSNNYMPQNCDVELLQAEDSINNLKETSEEDVNKQITSYAEVTLSDEQYEMLKEKGWILLEIKEKIFLLDTSGLHEITDNPKLVNKLKLEMVSQNDPQSGSSMKVCDESDVMEIDNVKNVVQQETNTMKNFVIHKEPVKSATATEDPIDKIEKQPIISQANRTPRYSSNIEKQKKAKTVVLKSQYGIKDIPDKIILGKTASGKNLVARMVKRKGFFKQEKNFDQTNKPDLTRDHMLNEKHLTQLVHELMHGMTESTRIEDVNLAKAVVLQLLQMQEFQNTLRKHKLIITKTVTEENNEGFIKKECSLPTIITGKLKTNGANAEFVHIPDMLNEYMKNLEAVDKQSKGIEDNDESEGNQDRNIFLHISITETRSVDNISKMFVMIKERYLPLSQVYNMKNEQFTDPVYSCPACAKVFKTQEDLDSHQKEKDCQLNLQTDTEINQEEPGNIAKDPLISDGNKQTEVVYKCKMCPNTYFHSSSLTKHILAKHVKMVSCR